MCSPHLRTAPQSVAELIAGNEEGRRVLDTYRDVITGTLPITKAVRKLNPVSQSGERSSLDPSTARSQGPAGGGTVDLLGNDFNFPPASQSTAQASFDPWAMQATVVSGGAGDPFQGFHAPPPAPATTSTSTSTPFDDFNNPFGPALSAFPATFPSPAPTPAPVPPVTAFDPFGQQFASTPHGSYAASTSMTSSPHQQPNTNSTLGISPPSVNKKLGIEPPRPGATRHRSASSRQSFDDVPPHKQLPPTPPNNSAGSGRTTEDLFGSSAVVRPAGPLPYGNLDSFGDSEDPSAESKDDFNATSPSPSFFDDPFATPSLSANVTTGEASRQTLRWNACTMSLSAL